MAFEDFTNCAGERGLRDLDVLEQYGKEFISDMLDAWRSLPQDLKTAIIATVTAIGEYAGAAIVAMGFTAGEVLAYLGAGVLAGVGLAVGMDVLYECLAQW